MTKCLGLVPAEGAQPGVIGIEPGGVSSQVAHLRTHLMNATSHKLPQSHEGVWSETEGVGVVARDGEGSPMFHHKCLRSPFQSTVGVCHDFVT